MAVTAPSQVLLIGDPGSPHTALIRERLHAARVAVDLVNSPTEAARLLREPEGQGPVAVLIAPGKGWPLHAARQVREASRNIHLVFLTEAGQEEPLRRSLMFAPLIGSGWSQVSLAEPDRLGERLSEIVEGLARHRAHEAALSQINLQLARFERPAPRERLALVESQLASLLTHADQAIFATGPDGRITAWNHAAEQVFGRTAQEALGGTLEFLLPPRRHPERPDLLQQVGQGDAVTLEMQWPHEPEPAPGTQQTPRTIRPCYLEVKLAPIRDREGKVLGVLALAADVTERRLRERRQQAQIAVSQLLAGSPSLHEALPRALQVICEALHWDWCELWQVDRGTETLHCTHAWRPDLPSLREFAAVTREQRFRRGEGLPGRAWQRGQPEWIVDVVRDPNFPRAAAAARGGLHAAFAFPIQVGAEVVGVLGFMSREVQEPDPELLQLFTTISQQIGEYMIRKAAEAERDRLVDELAQRVQDLADADRRKNQFLAMLAHELRNPLAPIRNAAHLLKHRSDDPALQRTQGIIERQVTHLTRLVDDLLDVARITRGHIDLRNTEVDLAEVIGEAVDACREPLDTRGHQLSVLLPLEPLRLVGDRTRLVQIICNILINAAKYTPNGGRIQLTAEREETEHGPGAVLRFLDNGQGLSPDLLPRIFDLFTQAERSLDRSEGGLGIGLTLVKELVEQHGGTIEAHSEGLGQGSEFVVRLPVLPTVSRPRPETAPEPPAPFRRRRVLLVEDNVDSAATLQELLEMWGHEVQVADDGPAALKMAQGFHPEVVLLDIGLPQMDGYEVAGRLRLLPEAAKAVLIALTGYGDGGHRKTSQEAGFDHHLVKPVDLEQLQHLLT